MTTTATMTTTVPSLRLVHDFAGLTSSRPRRRSRHRKRAGDPCRRRRMYEHQRAAGPGPDPTTSLFSSSRCPLNKNNHSDDANDPSSPFSSVSRDKHLSFRQQKTARMAEHSNNSRSSSSSNNMGCRHHKHFPLTNYQPPSRPPRPLSYRPWWSTDTTQASLAHSVGNYHSHRRR